MLVGEFHHTLDNKNRLTVPARFREELGERFIITRGIDNCLFVYPLAEWELLEQRLSQLPFTKANARAFTRLLFSGAVEAEMDRQGRVLVPLNLKQYALIDKEVVIIGVSSRAEIWSLENWKQYQQQASDSFVEISEKLIDLEM